ncbi:MAG: hypothetical protein LUH16_00270 [Clostridiales bacterium]|nr:hypothetical protein [Clostridiales bacterium]
MRLGARLRTLWDGGESLRPLGLLLTGPEGCGRHTAAAHMVRFLWDKEFGSIWLSGHDLLAEGGLSAAQDRLNGLLDDFYDQEKGLCLVIERLEGWDDREELLAFLGQTLWDYWRMGEDYPPLFLILIDSGRSIPGLLRGRLQQCRMTPPNREQRLRFLENRGSASGLTHYVAADAFADNTEGFNYAQLMDLAGNLCMLVYQTDRGVTPEELAQLAAEQRGETPPAQRRAALGDALLKLVEALPELLKNGGGTGGGGNRGPEEDTEGSGGGVADSPSPGRPTREDLERMPVKQLTCELFGKERGEQLIQTVHDKIAASESAAEEEGQYEAN